MRSARIAALLLLYLMFSALIVAFVQVQTPDELAIAAAVNRGDISAESVPEAKAAWREGFLTQWFSDDADVRKAVEGIPEVILVVFHLSLFWLPIYIALMGFDQISGDVGGKAIRFLTVRSRRGTILVGKYLGQAGVLIILLSTILIVTAVYAKIRNTDFHLGLGVVVLSRLLLAGFTFSLAYLAISTLCSTAFRTPMVSLVINVIALFSFWLMDVIGTLVHKLGDEGKWKALSAMRFASPSHYSADLVHPDPSKFGVSVVVYVGFAVVFLSAAWVILRARDV